MLLKILEAILTQPGDAKFRKVKTSNKAFAGNSTIINEISTENTRSLWNCPLISSVLSIERSVNLVVSGLLALGGARDLVFKIGFEPTDDFMHLVLPETRCDFPSILY